MLLDERGVPMHYPTLFVTVRLRKTGLAANSIKNRLYDLRVLLRWEETFGRDLAAEFRNGRFLSLPDVILIRDFAGRKVRGTQSAQSAVERTAQFPEAHLAPSARADVVSKQVHYQRMTSIADYVEFLGQLATLQRDDADIDAAIDRMAKLLRQHRPRAVSLKRDEDPLVPTTVIESFVRVGSEHHESNPFRNGAVRRRNEVMFRLLFDTGIRLGELLSLRLDTMQLGQQPYITVLRTHDDLLDSRAYQPVVKTKERIMPIDDDLAYKIHRYAMQDRANTQAASGHPYLLVTHHRGQTCGQPLSLSAVSNQVFSAMRRVRPEFQAIHPHTFRHYFNYRLSQNIDEHNQRVLHSGSGSVSERISHGRERSIRAQLMGHRSVKSGEAYNRRHVREQSNKIARKLQKKLMKRVRESRGADE